jgi:glutathione S-transferase
LTREYAIKRYDDETRRLYGVVDKHLEGKTYLVGEKFTIADLKLWGWWVMTILTITIGS